jgi:hypothetical protein
MSKIEVDTIDTQSSTTLQVGSTNTSLIKIGTSGDTVEYPAGTTFTQSGTQNVTSGGAINVKSGGSIIIESGAAITNNGTATGFSADLTNLNATNLTSGTVPDARFPSVLPAVSAANLTNIPGEISWQSTIITANSTIVASRGYWINTTSGAVTITLPASASVGDRIILTDYLRTWGTNALTINPNSLKFQGNTTPNPVYNTSGQSVDLVYSGATQGWIPNSDDDVTLETPQSYSMEMLVIAGGGGAGSGSGGQYTGGGGGAGGYRTSTQTVNGAVTLTVTVGDGGVATSAYQQGNDGSNSSISGSGLTTITSAGGGGGARTAADGTAGGSGGGGGGWSYNTNHAGGVGNTPSTSPVQGYTGGQGAANNPPNERGGGGGGGSSAVGANATTNGGSSGNGGNGGDGTANSITGSSVTRAGGGGGGGQGGGSMGAGGSGGGGSAGSAGTANTGSGGGGGGSGSGGAGGKGVIILSMPDASYSGTTTGSPTVATGVSGKTVLTFTGTGSYTT